MASIAAGSASVTWTEKDKDKKDQRNFRVYTTNGTSISEQVYGAGQWSKGAQINQPCVALSAVYFESNGNNIRLYCLGESGGTTEWCFDPKTGWTKGASW